MRNIKEVHEAANQHIGRLLYLVERWDNEKEYEDIQDYLKDVQKRIPEAYKITDDFSIHFKCVDGEFIMEFELLETNIKCTATYIKA